MKNSAGKWGNKKKSTFLDGFKVPFFFLRSWLRGEPKEVALLISHTLPLESCVVVGLRSGSRDLSWDGRCVRLSLLPGRGITETRYPCRNSLS